MDAHCVVGSLVVALFGIGILVLYARLRKQQHWNKVANQAIVRNQENQARLEMHVKALIQQVHGLTEREVPELDDVAYMVTDVQLSLMSTMSELFSVPMEKVMEVFDEEFAHWKQVRADNEALQEQEQDGIEAGEDELPEMVDFLYVSQARLAELLHECKALLKSKGVTNFRLMLTNLPKN